MAKTRGTNEGNKDLFEAFKQGHITLGALIRECRERKGWSAEQLGKLYGYALRGTAITAGAIERMETTNEVPTNPKRRYMLAKLLDIPLGILSLEYLEQNNRLAAPQDPKKPIDMQGHETALQELKEQHHFNHAQDVLDNALLRIQDLHNAFPYRVKERKSIAKVLGGFDVIVGHIFRDRQDFASAVKYTTDAAVIAEASKMPVLRAEALAERASSYMNKAETTTDQGGKEYGRYYSKAMQDWETALKVGKLPPPIRVDLLLGGGIAYVNLAEKSTDIDAALKMADEAKTLMDQPSYSGDDDMLYPFKLLGKTQYYMDRATMLMRGRLEDLYKPDEALKLIKLARNKIDPSLLRRNAFLDIQAARVYIHKGEYPEATKLLRKALMVLEAIGSWTNIARLAQLYEVLKASSYGNSFEVAQLGIDLVRIQYPNLFS